MTIQTTDLIGMLRDKAEEFELAGDLELFALLDIASDRLQGAMTLLAQLQYDIETGTDSIERGC